MSSFFIIISKKLVILHKLVIMGMFDGKNSQQLQTLKNRVAMYNPLRTSEVNTDGTKSNSTESYSYLNKKNQVTGSKTIEKKN